MAEKPQEMTRSQNIRPGREVTEKEGGMSPPIGPEPTDNVQQVNDQEARQVDFIVGKIEDHIWDEGYDKIVDSMQKTSGDLSEAIGKMAGRMVNEEVKAAEKEGVEVSRDILIGVGGEIINALTEVAVHEGIIDFKSDEEQQYFQGNCLRSGLEKYFALGDDKVEKNSLINNAQTILRGQVPEDQIMAKMGVQVPADAQGVV